MSQLQIRKGNPPPSETDRGEFLFVFEQGPTDRCWLQDRRSAKTLQDASQDVLAKTPQDVLQDVLALRASGCPRISYGS